ncbi:MAG: hypothetical protein FWD57_15925, partial [Polyangiaceae bacterium]|nr:hypothetical protein [Polyangiaceae bacterium]
EYGSKRISMSDYYAIKKRACTNGSAKCTNSHIINYQAFLDAARMHFGGIFSAKYKHIDAMGTDHGVKNGI